MTLALLLALAASAAPVVRPLPRATALPRLGTSAPSAALPPSGPTAAAPTAPLIPAAFPSAPAAEPPAAHAPEAAALASAPRAGGPSAPAAEAQSPEGVWRARFDGARVAHQDDEDDTHGLLESLAAVQQRRGVLPEAARGHRYLLVPGLFWDAAPDYFQPSLRRLQALGLDARIVPIHPLETSKQNARRVKEALEADERPAVVIGHSKGGLDVLAALEAHPGLDRRVAALVALQTPYAGTPVADWAAQKRIASAFVLAMGRLLNPRRTLAVNPFFRSPTIAELSRAARAVFADRRPALRAALFSVGTRIGSGPVRPVSRVIAKIFELLGGGKSDGLVAPEHARIPGSRWAGLEGVAHHDLVSEHGHWRQLLLGIPTQPPGLPEDFTEALVRWVFSR